MTNSLSKVQLGLSSPETSQCKNALIVRTPDESKSFDFSDSCVIFNNNDMIYVASNLIVLAFLWEIFNARELFLLTTTDHYLNNEDQCILLMQ